jgi:phage tail-like protein
MPNDLISNDPIVARNFYLELDGENLVLSGVSGLEIELDVVSIQQNGKDGRQQHIKTLGGALKAPELTITRMAPLNAASDPLWTWFLKIRNEGMKATARSEKRKTGSIVLYDSAYDEVGRFNFYGGWPSKITTDPVSTDSNEPMKETVTLQVDRVDRIK